MGTPDEKQPLATSTPPKTYTITEPPTPKESHRIEFSCLAVLCLVLGFFIIFGNPVLAYHRYMLDPATDMGRCVPPTEDGMLPGLGGWTEDGKTRDSWSGIYPRRRRHTSA